MSSGPDSGITSGPQMSMDQFESEQKAKENEDKVASSLSQNGNGSKVELPKDKSQLSHIFGDRPGHLPDTPGNRKKLTDLANDKNKFVGSDRYGNSWNVENNSDGSQTWVRHKNGTINEGGQNKTPRPWNDETGLNNNPVKRRKKNK